MSGPPQDLVDALGRLREQTSRPPASAGDTAADVGMSAASGGASALTSLAGLPAWLLNLVSRNVPQGAIPFFPTAGVPSIPPQQTLSTQITGERRAVPPVQAPGTPEDIQSLARLIPGAGTLFDYQPRTDVGRYTKTGVEWALPAVLGGPGGIVRRLLTGAAGGGAAQGATDLSHQIVPEAYRPYVDPIIGGVAGLLTMGRLNAPMLARANPSAIVREATRDIPEAVWQRAQARMDAGNAAGFRIMPVEALGAEGAGLQGIASDVAASRAGGPIRDVFAGRRDEALASGEQAIAGVGGPPTAAADTVRNVAEGAADRVATAQRNRTAAASPFYEAAVNDPVAPGSVRVVRPPDVSFDPLSQTRARLDYYQRRIESATNGAQLDNIYKDMGDEIEALIANNRGSTTAHHLGQMRQALDAQLTGAPGVQSISPNIAAGRAIYRGASPAVDALEQPDVLGRLTRELGSESRVDNALTRQIDVIHGATQTPQQIRRVFNEMSMSTQPQAARDLGAILLRNTLNDAARTAPTSPDAPLTAARLASTLMETPALASRTEAVVRGMAQASGQNPDTVWAGFSRLLDVFGQTGRIPAVGSRTAPRAELARSVGGNWGSRAIDALNISRGSVLRDASTALAERAGAADYEALARALAHPDGMQALRDLAGQIPNSPRAQMMVTRFLELGRQEAGTAAPQGQR